MNEPKLMIRTPTPNKTFLSTQKDIDYTIYKAATIPKKPTAPRRPAATTPVGAAPALLELDEAVDTAVGAVVVPTAVVAPAVVEIFAVVTVLLEPPLEEGLPETAVPVPTAPGAVIRPAATSRDWISGRMDWYLRPADSTQAWASLGRDVNHAGGATRKEASNTEKAEGLARML